MSEELNRKAVSDIWEDRVSLFGGTCLVWLLDKSQHAASTVWFHLVKIRGKDLL